MLTSLTAIPQTFEKVPTNRDLNLARQKRDNQETILWLSQLYGWASHFGRCGPRGLKPCGNHVLTGQVTLLSSLC